MIVTARFQYKTELLVSSLKINQSPSLELFDSAHFRLTGILLLSSILLSTSKHFR